MVKNAVCDHLQLEGEVFLAWLETHFDRSQQGASLGTAREPVVDRTVTGRRCP